MGIGYSEHCDTSKYRSSHRKCSVKKGVLRNFGKFTGKYLCQSLFFNKVAGLKKRLWHRCFPVNFAKNLRAPLFTEQLSYRIPLRDRFCKWCFLR